MISRTLAALGDANATDHDIQRVQTNLSIEAQNAGSTDVFRVMFRHQDERYAQEFLETHLKVFLASEAQRDLRLPRLEVQFLSEQLRETGEELSRLEAEPTESEPPLYATASELSTEPCFRSEGSIMERTAAREKLAAINRQLSIVKAGLERNETTIDDRFTIVTPVHFSK